MIWLSNSTIARLRDQLQARGQRPSIVASEASDASGASNGGAGVTLEAVEQLNLVAEYGPLCEAMYLMMSADNAVGNEEREVLKGALRNLSGDTIRGTEVDALLDAASKRVADEGRDVRMTAVVESLRADGARAEVAFVLAAAIAFADNAIADQENDTLNTLAEGLGIDEGRANALLDDVEKDLSSQAETHK